MLAIKKVMLTAIALLVARGQATAIEYLVDPTINMSHKGTIVKLDTSATGFRVGQTAFSTVDAAFNQVRSDISNGYTVSTRVFFAPGTYSGFEITEDMHDVEFYGSNYFCDQYESRNYGESYITGQITVSAGNITINGFCFTGKGCIRNESASSSSPLYGVKIIYNKFVDTSLVGTNQDALVYFGHAYRPMSTIKGTTDPAAGCNRYNGITISHNRFEGKQADYQPDCIQLAGTYGDAVNVTDNYFKDGGTSINMFNNQGQFNIEHNRFVNVGAGLKKAYAGSTGGSDASGQFCIRLYYISPNNDGLNGYIRYNSFENCQGQSGIYSLIRFWDSDSEGTHHAQNCKLYINHNTFKGKTQTNGNYNYVFYGSAATCENTLVDWRFNEFDNSEYCFGIIKTTGNATAGKYFAGSSGHFRFESSTGTTLGIYGDTGSYKENDVTKKFTYGRPIDFTLGKSISKWKFGANSLTTANSVATTVVQSSDIDYISGDLYTVNECNQTTNAFIKENANQSSLIKNSSNVIMFFSKVSGSTQEHMYVGYGSHGSNMAVTRHNGNVLLATGSGCSYTGSTPTKVTFFQWVKDEFLDLAAHKYGFGTNSYEIFDLNNNWNTWGGTHPYPSIDNDNRLLVVRTRIEGSGDHFTVFDLDEVFANPNTVKPIRDVFVAEHTKKITGSSRAFFNTADLGFKTWSDQGFTISGDYIYTYEGNGKSGYSGTPTPTDSKATLIQNVINWRTGEYVARTAMLSHTILDDMCTGYDTGEPESLKIHRDSDGRPFMMCGIVSGASGARSYSLFCYRQKSVAGQGQEMTIPINAINPNQSGIHLTSVGETTSSDVSAAIDKNVRNVTATVTGIDAKCFKVEHTAGEAPYDTNHSYRVSFVPDQKKNSYSARLRLSAPNAADVYVPLMASYNGAITGVEDLTVDQDLNAEGPDEYYDLQGRRLATPQPGINIVKHADGTVSKVYMHK